MRVKLEDPFFDVQDVLRLFEEHGIEVLEYGLYEVDYVMRRIEMSDQMNVYLKDLLIHVRVVDGELYATLNRYRDEHTVWVPFRWPKSFEERSWWKRIFVRRHDGPFNRVKDKTFTFRERFRVTERPLSEMLLDVKRMLR